MVFVSENFVNYTVNWPMKSSTDKVLVYYPDEDPRNVDFNTGDGFLQYTFDVGIATVYQFGVGDILLCYFHVTILQSKC